MEIKKGRMGTYAGYFISGAAIGTVLGVLFAPKAGSKTREEMSLWLKEKRAQGRHSYKAMADALERGRKTLRAKAKELSGV